MADNYGYDKKPLWQWIVIYLIIGGLIYGLIYYFVFAKKGGYSYQMNSSNSNPSSVSPTSMSNQENVTLTQDDFSPRTLTIKAGTMVVWTNKSGDDATVNSDPHPIHTDYPPLNLGNFADGGTLNLRFDKPGTYGYHNHLNPAEKGTIIVQ